MSRPVEAADVGVAGDIDTVEGNAGRVGIDRDVLDDQVVRRVVGDGDPCVARCLELAAAGQRVARDADAAELRLDVGHRDEVGRRPHGRNIRQRRIDHVGIRHGVRIAGDLAVEDEQVVGQVVALCLQGCLLCGQCGYRDLQRLHDVGVVRRSLVVGSPQVRRGCRALGYPSGHAAVVQRGFRRGDFRLPRGDVGWVGRRRSGFRGPLGNRIGAVEEHGVVVVERRGGGVELAHHRRQLVEDDVVLLRRQRCDPRQGSRARADAGAAAGAENDGTRAIHMRQAQFNQLVFEEIDFGLIGVACRRAGVFLGQLDQQGTALVDVGRDADLEIDRRFRHTPGAGDLEFPGPRRRVVVLHVERQAGILIDTGFDIAIDPHAGETARGSAAAAHIEGHVVAAEQIADAAGDRRRGFAIDVLADADGVGENPAAVGGQGDVGRGLEIGARAHGEVGVVEHAGQCIRQGRDRDRRLVPEIDGGARVDATRVARGVTAGGQVDGAVVGAQQGAGADHGIRGTAIDRVGAAVRGTGQAVGIGRRAGLERGVVARTGVDAADVADDFGVAAETGRGIGTIDADHRVGLGDRDGAAGVQLGLVARNAYVAGIQGEHAVAGSRRQDVDFRVVTDTGRGHLFDAAFALSGRGADHAAGTGTDVPCRRVAAGAAQPVLLDPVFGAYAHRVRQYPRVVPGFGQDRAIYRVAGEGAAGARERGIEAVHLGVEARGVGCVHPEAADTGQVRAVTGSDRGKGIAGAAGGGGCRRPGDQATAAGRGCGEVVVGAAGLDVEAAA